MNKIIFEFLHMLHNLVLDYCDLWLNIGFRLVFVIIGHGFVHVGNSLVVVDFVFVTHSIYN